MRSEIDRLRGRGVGVTKKELDRYLDALRAQIEALNTGGEAGSAAFRWWAPFAGLQPSGRP